MKITPLTIDFDVTNEQEVDFVNELMNRLFGSAPLKAMSAPTEHPVNSTSVPTFSEPTQTAASVPTFSEPTQTAAPVPEATSAESPGFAAQIRCEYHAAPPQSGMSRLQSLAAGAATDACALRQKGPLSQALPSAPHTADTANPHRLDALRLRRTGTRRPVHTDSRCRTRSPPCRPPGECSRPYCSDGT